jgi:serine/threonine-protein kinase
VPAASGSSHPTAPGASAKADSNPPAPISTKPAGINGAALDMDWDDDDEATHVYDKDSSQASAAAPPSSDRERVAAAPQSVPTQKVQPKTLIGVNGPGLAAPPPPPPPPHSSSMRSAPPVPPPSGSMRAAPISQRPGAASQSAIPSAPPSVGTALARASSVPSGAAGPVANPLPPPPPGGPTVGRSSFPPPPPPPGTMLAPQQTVTAPMPMPARPASGYPSHPASGAPASGAAQAVPSTPPRNALEPTAMVRPQGGGKTGVFVGMTILFLAILGAAAVFFLVPRTGRVMVNVADAKGGQVNRLEVFLDGRKQCDTVPCGIEQVTAGTHQVKVLAQGYEPATKAVTVEARKDSSVDLTLVPTSAGTGLRVSGTQPGVKLFVDGREIGPLPQELKDLAPGDHKIRIAERPVNDPTKDRYAAAERNVIVVKDEMTDLGSMNLKVVKGKATISLATPGAKVYLVSGTDRRELPTLPISVDIDTSKQWMLEAMKLGFLDYRQPISFEDGQAEKTFAITLEPKGSAPVATPTPQPTADAPQPAPTHAVAQPAPRPQPTAAAATATADKPAPTTDKPAATAEKPAPAAAAGGEAFLNINSIPASSVVLDGKPIGNTPKVKVSVTPGTHTVLFINSEQGLKKSITVTVGAGETKPAIAKLKGD